MPMHVLSVNENTLDFIQKVNGGVRPTEDWFENPTFFVHSDRIDDADPNQLMTKEQFRATYKFHVCDDNNCNIVEKK